MLVMSEPMIAVKKADGTIVRVPLSEIKKMKESAATTTQTASTPVPKPDFKIPVPEDALVVQGKIPVQNLGGAAGAGDPMSEVKRLLSVPELDPAPRETLIPESFQSSAKPHAPLPLHEPEDHEILQEAVLGTPSYQDVVARVLSEAKIIPPPDLTSRYQSLIMSAAKGVRTIEQVLRYAVMSNVQGGLGLDTASVERLGRALEKVPGIQVPIAPVKRATPTEVAMQAQLAPSTPNPALFARPTMRDVEPPTQTIPLAAQTVAVMGPVDEMQNFSLVDWRRLAVTPEKAAEIVMRKFAVWKEESFYLYQDARAAWLSSPLIREYQKTLATAINQNTRLSGLSMGGNARGAITAGDIGALVAVNRSLAV